jgi:hypothetical protein
VQQEKYAYLDSSNVDAMYLLAKQLYGVSDVVAALSKVWQQRDTL